MTIYKDEEMLIEKIDEYLFGEVYLSSNFVTGIYQVVLLDENNETIKKFSGRDVDVVIEKFNKWLNTCFKRYKNG